VPQKEERVAELMGRGGPEALCQFRSRDSRPNVKGDLCLSEAPAWLDESHLGLTKSAPSPWAPRYLNNLDGDLGRVSSADDGEVNTSPCVMPPAAEGVGSHGSDRNRPAKAIGKGAVAAKGDSKRKIGPVEGPVQTSSGRVPIEDVVGREEAG